MLRPVLDALKRLFQRLRDKVRAAVLGAVDKTADKIDKVD